MDIID
jgi:thioredoxin-like negative regulator of GroEL